MTSARKAGRAATASSPGRTVVRARNTTGSSSWMSGGSASTTSSARRAIAPSRPPSARYAAKVRTRRSRPASYRASSTNSRSGKDPGSADAASCSTSSSRPRSATLLEAEPGGARRLADDLGDLWAGRRQELVAAEPILQPRETGDFAAAVKEIRSDRRNHPSQSTAGECREKPHQHFARCRLLLRREQLLHLIDGNDQSQLGREPNLRRPPPWRGPGE